MLPDLTERGSSASEILLSCVLLVAVCFLSAQSVLQFAIGESVAH
jgi:hypothetical protein